MPEGGADERACKPDPVPGRLAARRSAAIRLGPPSSAGSCGLPAGSGGPPSDACAADRLAPVRLLTLLRVGFTEPPRSPEVLVVSYTTVSPLPRSRGAVCSLWHCPAGRPGLPLATTLPCGVRTFLGDGPRGTADATARPARPLGKNTPLRDSVRPVIDASPASLAF